jgi:peroxin-1
MRKSFPLMPQLRVSLLHQKNTLTNIPLRWAQYLYDDPNGAYVVVRINGTGFGWSGGCSTAVKGQETIELDFQVAKACGLKDGQHASVEFLHDVPIAKTVQVEPVGSDDWEILELNAGIMEEQLLNQCRVVNQGQLLHLWVNDIGMKVRVVELDPKETCIRLDRNCEVYVAPKPRESKKLVLPARIVSVSLNEDSHIDLEGKIGLPFEFGYSSGAIVFVQNFDLDHLLLPVSEQAEQQNKRIKSGFFEVYVQPGNQVLLDSQAMQELGLRPLSRIRIQSVSAEPIGGGEITVQTNRIVQSSSHTLKIVKEALSLKKYIFDGLYFRLSGNPAVQVLLQFQSDKKGDRFVVPQFIRTDPGVLEKIDWKHRVHTQLQLPQFPSFDFRKYEMPGFKKVLECCLMHLEDCHLQRYFELRTPPIGGLLVHGKTTSGKTTLLRKIAYESRRKWSYFSIYVDCNEIKTLKLSIIQKYIDRIIMQCKWHQPTLLLLDNLDSLAQSDSEVYFA